MIMIKNTEGVLPSQDIQKLIQNKKVGSLHYEISKSQIQPSSLDLTLGEKAWRIRASFLPGENNTVEDKLKTVAMYELNLNLNTVLEKGSIYIIKLNETLRLPENLDGSANAKSSSGRVDLFTRLLSDYSDEFDTVKAGYDGHLYAEVQSKSFSVEVQKGLSLNQIRFKKGKVNISDIDLRDLHFQHSLIDTEPNIKNGLGFSINLINSKSGLVGYKAKTNAPVINLSEINYYEPSEYWEEIKQNGNSLILNPNDFYILSSREAVKIPLGYAAEMLPYLAKIGEFRVHYAGFFDPGFGVGGSFASKAVLEVRCHEAPFKLEHGQQVGRLIFERMLYEPDISYGTQIKSNYQGQSLKLSKHFKS